jgi:hypothetical protein
MSKVIAWLGRWLRGYGQPVPLPDADQHLRLEQAFRECPGQFVAIDRKTGVVRAAETTPYALAAKIKSERITDVDVLRAPAVDEPEVVGFG